MKNMKCIIFLLVAISFTSVNAVETKDFESHPTNAESSVKLSVIDLSDYSMQWLTRYSHYLIDNNIPVMILNSTKSDAIAINNRFKGLKSGPAPAPQYIELFLQQWGINAIPAVLENGQAWQEKKLGEN